MTNISEFFESENATTAASREIVIDLSDIGLATFLSLIIVTTILGNTLIIAAVATTRRLRTVTNYFVVSLAASDLLVGLLVMPMAVAKEIADGQWLFGPIACELWVSMDIMLCTASILNLCCISLDRYFAITSPLTYAVKRSARLCVLMIAAVWVVSALITCPPMFGLNERPSGENSTSCEYITNQGYVIYSALGSFYIPAIIMVYVYCRIFAVARKRQAVLMQGADENKENQGSDSNSSVGGDKVQTTENPRIVVTKDTVEAMDTALPDLVENHEASPTPALHRRNSFSIFRSASTLRTRTYSFNPRRKLRHKHRHRDKFESSEEDASLKVDEMASSSEQTPNSSFQCQYCITEKESSRRTRFHNTFRKKEGYERAAFQRERRVAKSLSVVVGGFIVCWLPFFTVYLIEPFCKSCYFHPILNACLVWLGWINSAVNPFIYALNSKDFKKAFIRLTIGKCKCCHKKRKGHDPQQFI